MKKIILPLLLLMFPFVLQAYQYTYGSDVFVDLRFENNYTNAGSGTDTFSATNSPPFSSSIFFADVYSAGKFDTTTQNIHGTVSYATPVTVQFRYYPVSSGFPGTAYILSTNSQIPVLYIFSGTLYLGVATTLSGLNYDAWNTIKLVYTGTNLKAYINEVYSNQMAYSGYPTGQTWYIGNGPGYTVPCGGYIDEFLISSTSYDNVNDIPTVVNNSPTITPSYTPTFTITPTYTITPTQTSSATPLVCSWTQITASAPWPSRYAGGVCVFNDMIFICGGINDDSGATYYNDVWYSPDGGYSWACATNNAAWSPRYRQKVAAWNGAMYLFGGIDSGGTWNSDVWTSTDGATWTLVTSNALGVYCCGELEPFNGNLYYGAGQQMNRLPYGVAKEVWHTSDGPDWIPDTMNAEFNGRSGLASAVAFGALWYGGGAGTGGNTNDVWYTTNAYHWTQGGTIAPTSPFEHLALFEFVHNSTEMLGQATGNYGNPGNPTNLFQWSTDGIIWHYDTGGYAPARGFAFTAVWHGNIYIMGGWTANTNSGPLALNDIWVSNFCDITPSATPTLTQTITRTPRPTLTVTYTDTPTFTITATPTSTQTRVITPYQTFTRTVTFTPTFTPTKTQSPTISPTSSAVYTHTITPTPSITYTRTCCPTFHVPTFTPTLTIAPTPHFNIVSVIATYIYGIMPTETPTHTPTP